MTHSSPVNAELLADRLQRVIDSFDAQRQKYHNNASDPGFNGMQQEAWASLANEKADDLRVLRKLLVQSGIRAQCVPTPSDEMVETACAAYAKATDYYVEFHRGLSSASADRMRVGMRAALSALTSPEHQSAPAYAAAHNSGEGDPSVMPDYAGADTAIQPQRMPVAWRWRHVNDPNFAWHYQETAIGNANEYLQVEPLYALSRPKRSPIENKGE